MANYSRQQVAVFAFTVCWCCAALADVEGPTTTSASRLPESAFEAPRATSETDAGKTLGMPQTGADLLLGQPGLFIQRRSRGMVSPVLRGHFGNRVLMLVDGIRLNNALARYDDTELLATIDPLETPLLEVTRGPSVAYGSDAIGGVINFRRRPYAYDPFRAWDLGGRAVARFDSASTAMLGNLGAEGHLRRIGVQLSGSLHRFDDLHAGNDDLQHFSGYWGGNATLAAMYKLRSRGELRASYTVVRENDLALQGSRPDDFEIADVQSRDLIALRYSDRYESFIDEIDAVISYHLFRYHRERFRLDSDRIEREVDRDGVLSASVTLQSRLPYNRLRLGADVSYDSIASSAEQEAISNRTVKQYDRGRYVDDSSYLRLGFFLADRLSLGKLAIDLGGRLAGYRAQLPAERNIDVSNMAVMGSLRGRYLVGDGLNLIAGVSQGYRAPNIDDYSANRCGVDHYEIPNDDLKPERSLNLEAGVKLDFFGRLRGSLFYHYSYLPKMIVPRRASLDTSSTAPCGTNVDGSERLLPIVKRENVSGTIHGLEGELLLEIDQRFTLFAWIAWTRGETRDARDFTEPLSRIPPLNGLAGLRYRSTDLRWRARLGLRWAARQERLSRADREDNAICALESCRGTPGYAAVEIQGAVRLHKTLHLTLAIDNLTDHRYRLHGAGLNEAGIRAVVGMALEVAQ